MTDARGEGLLAVPQLTSQAEEGLEVFVTGWFDPNSVQMFEPRLPDPDQLLNYLASPAWKTASLASRIAPNKVTNVRLLISV